LTNFDHCLFGEIDQISTKINIMLHYPYFLRQRSPFHPFKKKRRRS